MVKRKAKTKAFRVSVVVPHVPYTRIKELARLREALQRQTVQSFELLIIEKKQSAFKSNNEGWRKAKGDIVWFIADDMVPEPDALEKALQVFRDKDPDGVEGHIYGLVERIYDWGFMSGHIFYKRKVLQQYGGFDERFKGWRGDTDFAWTVLDGGGKIIYCPESKAMHPGRPTTVPNMEAERLLQKKHPERYELAKQGNHLHCYL